MKHCHYILLADTNEVFCGLLQESIALRRDYMVARAKKGRDILRSVQEKQPALLIMDPDFPDVNGAEIMRELRRQKFAPHTIITSAKVSNRLREEFFALGAVYYLPKPFSHNYLLRSMDYILREM